MGGVGGRAGWKRKLGVGGGANVEEWARNGALGALARLPSRSSRSRRRAGGGQRLAADSSRLRFPAAGRLESSSWSSASKGCATRPAPTDGGARCAALGVGGPTQAGRPRRGAGALGAGARWEGSSGIPLESARGGRGRGGRRLQQFMTKGTLCIHWLGHLRSIRVTIRAKARGGGSGARVTGESTGPEARVTGVFACGGIGSRRSRRLLPGASEPRSARPIAGAAARVRPKSAAAVRYPSARRAGCWRRCQPRSRPGGKFAQKPRGGRGAVGGSGRG